MVAEARVLLGREFAGYRLTEIVGQGDMSTVYHGRRVDDEYADAAVKVLRASPDVPGGHATFRTRFFREAQTVAALRHDHIISVLDYGEWQGMPYMVMPLATGGTLAGRLATTPHAFPLAAAAEYAIQLASALDHAHWHGIVHRDVKPSNALLDAQGRLLLADFGIARLYTPSARGEQATALTALTSAGEIMGTPSYMAPEQFRGQRIGPAADIYALGVVLYLCATGRLPFEGETPVAVGMAHLWDIPLSPQLLRPELPAPAAAAILGALAKDPAWRFDSAGTLAGAFAAGVAGRWTAENRVHARDLGWDQTPPYRVESGPTGAGRQATASSRPLRLGMVAVAVVALLIIAIAFMPTVQNGGLPSASARSKSAAAVVGAAERLATSGRGPTLVVRYDGAQVYALWPDGSRRWTVWADGALVGPPTIRDDVVALTTVRGTRYTVRASDGAILTRVVATATPGTATPGTGKGHGDNGHSGNDGKGDGGEGDA